MISMIGVLSFIVFIVFLVIYFKKKNNPSKKKNLYIALGALLVTIVCVVVYEPNPVESIKVKNVDLFKDKSVNLEYEYSPDDADNSSEIVCKIKNEKVAKLEDDKIIGVGQGETTYTCSIDDDENKVISNNGKIKVSLTEKQIAEKKAADKKAKEKAKAEEKAAKEKAKAEAKEKANSLTITEKSVIKDYCEDLINGILKAPSTAEYPGAFLDPFEGWTMFKKDNLVTVSSYVDSQNGFGAMLRSNFVIQIKMNADGSGKATYVQFDGEDVMGTFKD